MLIIQGTDFNYTENIAFKNTFQTAKADAGVSESVNYFYHVTTVPSTGICRTLQKKKRQKRKPERTHFAAFL